MIFQNDPELLVFLAASLDLAALVAYPEGDTNHAVWAVGGDLDPESLPFGPEDHDIFLAIPLPTGGARLFHPDGTIVDHVPEMEDFGHG